jgi:predicted hotdog family 3-hydroxylacyl-ACP dehydratase
MLLNHQQIAERIPHAGNMCLLHSVTAWDEQSVSAIALSHREISNPLRNAQGLGIVAGIEYAAQSIAVHGSLVSGNLAPRPGRLVSTRNVLARVRWLHLIEDELQIEAQKILGDDSGLVYDFQITAARRTILSGRASISLLTMAQP